jgi:hypothetical protein
MNRITSKGAIVLALALVPRAVAAQPSEASRAAAVALFDDAQKLVAEGSYAAACSKFSESNRLDPQLGALVHLADCYEKAGRLASAWASWRDAVESAQKLGDPREKLARDRAAALGPKLSKLVIEVPARSDLPGLEIKRDGTLVSRSVFGTPIPVDAGEHLIEASAPGKKKLVAKVSVGEGAVVERHAIGELDDDPNAATDGAGGGTAAQGRPAGADAGSNAGATQRTLGWIAGGLGVVGLGAGLAFEFQRSAKDSERRDICPSGKGCDPDDQTRVNALNDDVSRAATLEAVSFIAGGALLAGGVVLLLTAPSDTPRSGARWMMVSPSVARGSLGVSAVGSW